MLSKALRIVPLLALGAIVPSLQEARETAVPVAQVQALGVHQDLAALAPRKKKDFVKRPGFLRDRNPKPPIKKIVDKPVTTQPVLMSAA